MNSSTSGRRSNKLSWRTGQLAGLQSLRDIVGNLYAQPHKLYHLGVRALVSRSSLARVNTEQPYILYEVLFERLLARCQQRAPRHGFRFKNPLYALDASTIDLCLAAEAEGDELRPAAHHAESLAFLVLPGLGVEFMLGKQVQKLPEDCVMMGHGLDLPSFERFRAKSFYQTEKVQAALI